MVAPPKVAPLKGTTAHLGLVPRVNLHPLAPRGPCQVGVGAAAALLQRPSRGSPALGPSSCGALLTGASPGTPPVVMDGGRPTPCELTLTAICRAPSPEPPRPSG